MAFDTASSMSSSTTVISISFSGVMVTPKNITISLLLVPLAESKVPPPGSGVFSHSHGMNAFALIQYRDDKVVFHIYLHNVTRVFFLLYNEKSKLSTPRLIFKFVYDIIEKKGIWIYGF